LSGYFLWGLFPNYAFYWAKHQSFQPFQLIMHLTEVHHERDFKNANANANASMGTLNPFGGFLRLVGEG